MTRHLGDVEFVDLLDGTLRAGRVRHFEACAECRRKADALRMTIAAGADDQIPEPSPLFWEHFSARVRTAVAEEPLPSRGFLKQAFPFRPVAARWAALGTAAAVLFTVVIWREYAAPRPSAVPPAQEAAVRNAADSDGIAHNLFGDIDADEAWAVVRSVADQLEEDEIRDAGMGSRPGSSEQVVSALSEAEQVELAAVIEDEIKAYRATEPSS